MSFLFAWKADGTPTFSESEHGVDGQEIFSLVLECAEGDFPAATVTIQNPREGLLSEYRSQWAWISWDNDSDGTIIPLFLGRVLGVPNELQGEIIEISLQARPVDFDQQLAALADSLKVAPYYDPIWIALDRLGDPDSVLEGYNGLWHVDPVTHVVTLSDNNRGEAGTLILSLDDEFYDDLRVEPAGAPLSRVDVTATVKWSQAAAGSLDLTTELIAAFAAVSRPHGPGQISSYSGQGLVREWPFKGDNIGHGWRVGETDIVVLSGTALNADYKVAKIVPQAEPVEQTEGMSDEEYENLVAEAQAEATANPIIDARFYNWIMRPTFGVEYEAQRERIEVVNFSVTADVQPILYDDAGKAAAISVASSSVALSVDGDGQGTAGSVSGSFDPGTDGSGTGAGSNLPIGDIRRSEFFNIARGKRAFETLLCFARAKLLLAARAVNVSGRFPIEVGFGLSCRHDGYLADDRIPGGEAAGKVTAYRLVFDDGDAYCEIVLGCTIGRGAELGAPTDGTPTYVAAEALGPDVQFYEGRSVIPISGELTYEDFRAEIFDDGLDLTNLSPAQALVGFTITNGEIAQEAVLNQTYPTVDDAKQAVIDAKTTVRVQMVPLDTGPYQTNIAPVVGALMIPKTIDLEAAAIEVSA